MWWIGLGIVILLVGIVIGVLIFAVFSSTASAWVQLIFLGALAGGVSLFLLFPAIRAGNKNELRASRTAGWELERKEVRTLAVLDLRTVAAGALRNNLGSRQASPGPV